MNPEVKAKWVARLRSGEDKQTTGLLQDSRGMCCLGVLCDIYSKENSIPWIPLEFSTDGRLLFMDVDAYPPEEVDEWAGNENGTSIVPGLYNREGEQLWLTSLNDEGMSFSQIADVIEYFL